MAIGHASQTFFFTAGFSMFSKVLGPRSNGTRMATLASSAAMGSTIGGLLGGRYSMGVYGTNGFYLTLIPSAIGVASIITPTIVPALACHKPFMRASLRLLQVL